MTYFFMTLNGMPDCIPNDTHFYAVETLPEAREIFADAIDMFCRDDYGHKALDFHPSNFGNELAGDASQWHWTMAWANEGSESLVLRGLTEAEFNEAAGEDS